MKATLLNMTAGEYHSGAASKIPSYSNSIGKIIINQSPLHAWAAHPILNPDYERVEKEAFDLGTAAHAALLEGIDVCEVLEFDDWRTNAAKDARREAREAGKIPMLRKDYSGLAMMYDSAQKAIASCADLGGLKLTDGKPEQAIHIEDGETHIKMRLDWLSDDRRIILDYKTTGLESPRAWMRSIGSAGHDMQAALYSSGVEVLTGDEPKFIFMVQEVNPPYACYFVGMNGQQLDIGRRKNNFALATWKECMRTGIWPAYTPRIMYPDVLPWVESEWVEREEMHKEETGADYTKEAFLFGKVKS